MIKNIIFDIGNVLTDFGWEAFIKKFGFSDEINEKIVSATVKSEDWDEYDRGVLTDEEILDRFIENDPSIENELRQFEENFSDLLVQFGYTKGLIKDLQNKGFKVYCLSNMSYKAIRECKEALDFLPMLDGYILSCNIKLIKPDLKIYEELLKKYNLKASECVFFDDLKKNTDAAEKVGIHGIVFKDLKSAISELETFVEEVSESEPKQFESKYSKKQRVGAVVCLSLIALLYLVTIVCTIIQSPAAKSILRVSLGATFVLPLLTWIYIWMIGRLTKKSTIADLNLFK